MAGKFSFRLQRAEPSYGFPSKLVIGQQETETTAHVLLKALAYLLFFRERLQLETNLHMDSIPFRPDVVQLDYELRPKLWIECGECSVNKLDKLAVKAPEAEIWVIKRSLTAAEDLLHAMAKAELRRQRYQLIGLDAELFEEMNGLLRSRNEVYWVHGSLDPPVLQLDFNGLWFEGTFTVLRF